MLRPVDSEDEASAATVGDWEYFTSENADGELWGYRLDGESADHYSWDLPPSLYLRCSSSGNGSVYVAKAELLFNDSDTDSIARYPTA